MYTLVGPSTLWPQAPMPGNQQVIYNPFPAAYVLAPLPAQAVLGQSAQPLYSGNQLSAWTNTPAAAQSGYRANIDGRLYSSDDEVFLPTGSSIPTTAKCRNTATRLGFPPPLSTTSSGPKTPRCSFTASKEAYHPATPGIRLPEKYTKARGKVGLKKTPSRSRKQLRRSANGSLNSSGGTSGSSHNTTVQSNNQNSTGPDFINQLANLSDVVPVSNTSGSGSDVSPPQASHNRRRDRSSNREMSSVSSCVLPMSLRAALNEDPPDPPKACAPLRTSSPIRECEEFLCLPTVIPPSMREAVRKTLKTLPPPIGAELSQFKKKALKKIEQRKDKEEEEEEKSPTEDSNLRKRREGRLITGASGARAKDNGQPRGGKYPRVSIGDEEPEMDQCLRILRQREQMGAAEEQSRRREEFLLVLEAERERQRRLVLPRKAPKMNCKFCRNNGESEEIYTKHRLHDDNERTVCPILRHYVCRLCNSTGDFAHTIRHCPFNNRKDRIAWKATFMV